MKDRRSLSLQFLWLFAASAAVSAQDLASRSVANWPAPPFWSPSPRAQADPRRVPAIEGLVVTANSSPLPFIGITPCRVADTRGNGFTGVYGPPAIGADTQRTFTIWGRCGVPSGAEAVSFNFAVLNVSAAGDLRVFGTGAPVSTVSTLNYNGNTPNIANAAIVPLGIGGAITVQADATTIDLIIDVNGYYGPAGSGDSSNLFLGADAGGHTTTGRENTGLGNGALAANTTGSNNTVVGIQTLLFNGSGSHNTAIGHTALLLNNDGNSNTAAGESALSNNVGGDGNAAFGDSALLSNSAGVQNTAIGTSALQGCTGSFNIALGTGAGGSLTTGSNNIDIGNDGVAGESSTIRIGTGGLQTRVFVAGVRAATTGMADGQTVMVDSLGQLGTVSSSAELKKEIADMGDLGPALSKLRPVSFLYRNDPSGIR